MIRSEQSARQRRETPFAGAAQPLPIDLSFDAAFADRMARLESYNKHHYRPNTYMHKWWARRCGSTFRLILKHLVTDAEQRDYYAAGGLAGKVVLDPMMGGGTTLHEAIRMGASVIGVDLDPIPVLQARATLSSAPLDALEAAFSTLLGALDDEIGPLFQTECPHCADTTPMRFLLYGARRRCGCGPAIMVDSLVLRYEGGRPQVRLCPRCHAVLSRGESCRCDGLQPCVPLVEKRAGACERCNEPYLPDKNRPFFQRYEALVVVGHCHEHGLFFAAPGDEDRARLAAADARRSTLPFGGDPALQVTPGPKSRDLVSHGITNYADLFSSRQLLYLDTALKVLPQYEDVVRLNLALLVSTSLEFNSMLCGYKGARRGERPGAIRHVFSYHAYSFPYTALENNLLYAQRSSGTLQKLFHDRIRRARRWARRPRERDLASERARFVPVAGEVDGGVEAGGVYALSEGDRRFLLHQGSAETLPLPDGCVDFVVTDPPYFDNVQYGDLAAFFRVWLKQLLDEEGAEQRVWSYRQERAAVSGNGNGNHHYLNVLADIFAECRRVMKPGGRLVFTFHHWKPGGWAALTIALKRAGFALINRYVVHSENPISVHIANLRALTHDAILVLAPVETVAGESWSRQLCVDKSDSEQFCHDCGSVLGWMLQADLREKEIRRLWRQSLQSAGNCT